MSKNHDAELPVNTRSAPNKDIPAWVIRHMANPETRARVDEFFRQVEAEIAKKVKSSFSPPSEEHETVSQWAAKRVSDPATRARLNKWTNG